MSESATPIVPKEEAKTVFDALFIYWKKVKNPARKQAISRLLLAAKQQEAEIEACRANRQLQRIYLEQKANINGNLLIAGLHDLEHKACQALCPALCHGTGTAKAEGWRWVLRQPWAKDFKAAPFEKRHHHGA